MLGVLLILVLLELVPLELSPVLLLIVLLVLMVAQLVRKALCPLLVNLDTSGLLLLPLLLQLPEPAQNALQAQVMPEVT